MTYPKPGDWIVAGAYSKDHLVGRTSDHADDFITWCGRPIETDWRYVGENMRRQKSNPCADCRRLEAEWLRIVQESAELRAAGSRCAW